MAHTINFILMVHIVLLSNTNIIDGCTYNNLMISCDHTSTMDGFQDTLNGKPDVQTIHWTHYPDKELKQELFGNKANNLSQLAMVNGEIESLSCKNFETFPKLKILDLDINKIVVLEQCHLLGIKKLTELHLSRNLLVSLPLKLFEVAPDLTILDLSDNKLTEIPENFLTDLTQLGRLDLSFNHLITLKPIFSSLKSLKILKIDSNIINGFVNITAETFNISGPLEEFSYDSTRFSFDGLDNQFRYMTQIDVNLINIHQFFSNVTILDDTVVGNYFEKASALDFSNLGIEDIILKDIHQFTNVGHVNLASNRLREIKPYLFSVLSYTNSLNLSRNQIARISEDAFHHFFELKILDLSDNFIEQLSEKTFSESPFLKMLSLKHNSIAEISNVYFDENTSLEEFDISDNKLTTLSFWAIGFPGKLDVLNVAMNPLVSIEVHGYYDKIANKIVMDNEIGWTVESNRNEFFEYCDVYRIKIIKVEAQDDIYQNHFGTVDKDAFEKFRRGLDDKHAKYVQLLSKTYGYFTVLVAVLTALCVIAPAFMAYKNKKITNYSYSIKMVNQLYELCTIDGQQQQLEQVEKEKEQQGPVEKQ